MTEMHGDEIAFETSGRVVYANRGIIGIGEGGAVFGGYDQPLLDAEFDEPLTPEEKKELATFMIEQWSSFAENKTERQDG